MYCTKCGKTTENKSGICDFCYQMELHEIAQQMEGIHQQNDLHYGKDESVLPQKPTHINLTVLSIMIPIVGVILGIINLSSGDRHAGRVYLLAGIISWMLYSILIFILK